MDYEEIKNKLQKINDNLKDWRVEEENVLSEFNEIYGEAKANYKLAEDLKNTISELKNTKTTLERRGMQTTITDEQIAELDKKSQILEEAIKRVRELEENSEKDKIDTYLASKIQDNKTTIEVLEQQNNFLSSKKEGLNSSYQEYGQNKRRQDKLEKLQNLTAEITKLKNNKNKAQNQSNDLKNLMEERKSFIKFKSNEG